MHRQTYFKGGGGNVHISVRTTGGVLTTKGPPNQEPSENAHELVSLCTRERSWTPSDSPKVVEF